jgi:rare lipoprotein A
MNANKIIFVILSFILASCSASVPRFTNERYAGEKKIERSHKEEYHPDKDLSEYKDAVPLDVFTGVASYYADQYNGRRTSSGEIYDMNLMTAASQDLPFDTIVRVINFENQKTVILRINDRGPLKKGRIIDISLEAAKRLEMTGKGTANVRVEVLKYGKR